MGADRKCRQVRITDIGLDLALLRPPHALPIFTVY